MARIRIEDLQPLQELTDEELSGVAGGATLNTASMYDAWVPSNYTSSTLSTSMTNTLSTNLMYDAWTPGG